MEEFDITPLPIETIEIEVQPPVTFTLVEKGLALGTPGLSAYEVWLKNGHTGTEQDYLDWVQGDGGAVKSVNDKTGDVKLSAADVGAEPAKAANLDYVTTEEKTAIGTIGNKVDKNGTDRLITEAEVITFNAKQNALGYTPENSVNKQNSLTTDGTGNKFPTVDAVNSGLSGKENTGVASALITQLINGATTDYDTLKKLENKIIAINSIIGGSAPDGDNIVNTVAELLAVFSTFPEGSDMVTLLTAKLSTSDVYNALDQLLAGKALDARQGKVLSDLCAGLRTDLTAHNHAGTYEPVIAPTVSTPADTDALLAKRGASWISLTFSAIKTALGSVFASITGSNIFVGVQSILGGLKVAKLYPSADSTTAVQVCKADGSTAVVNVDTTNKRVGLGTNTPRSIFEIYGDGLSNIGSFLLDQPTIPNGTTQRGPHFFFKSGGVDRGWFGFFDNSNHGNGVDLNLRAAGQVRFGSSIGSAPNMIIAVGGNVLINTTTNNGTDKLQVNGTCANTTGTWATLSDQRLKTNITPINNPIEKVERIAGCVRQYEFIDQDKYARGQRTGYIAQLLRDAGFAGHVTERDPQDEAEGAIFGWEYADSTEETQQPKTDAEGKPLTDDEGNPVMETVLKPIRIVAKPGDKVLGIENNFAPYIFPAIAQLAQENRELKERLAAIEAKLA